MNNKQDPIIKKYVGNWKIIKKTKKDVLIKFETDLSNDDHHQRLDEFNENMSSKELKKILQKYLF